jgi:hypothetical protein
MYLSGKLTSAQQKSVASSIDKEIKNNTVCPMLLVFLTDNTLTHFDKALPQFEEKVRIRKGYRFRAVLALQSSAVEACKIAVQPEQFTACILSDAFLTDDLFTGLVSKIDPKAMERTSFFIDAPDKGNFYNDNGNAHMLLRDKDMKHEYRVREGKGGFEWFMKGLPEIINYTAKRFHK